ncbi:hypothetical protein H0H92_001578 [Tricholoma furcatifolium]|nr:hypothetical protein H0H92_001578 [Tricholoma furcatifolium]
MSSDIPSQTPSPVSLDHESESNFTVPEALLKGTMMTKVSEKKQARALFQLDPDEGTILYKTKMKGTVALETVKEIRSGAGAQYYREQFGFPEEAEQRWLTMIYILEGAYKTLHMLADTREDFLLWDTAVRKLYTIRQGLMMGLGQVDLRESVWTHQYWKGADDNGDQKLSLDEVERLCWRLNARFSKSELQTMFKNADPENKGYLDFAGFQSFVRNLKRRPEIKAIYDSLCVGNGGNFDFSVFQKFMVETQKTKWNQEELKAIFAKYSSTSPAVTSTATGKGADPVPPAVSTTSSQDSASSVASTPILTLEGFSSFLISADNAAIPEINRQVWQDMTRPISEYFISSSHNTYLVGHQLIGVSTIEGYIRALLHSCRSVELDIYDGDTEPVVFHGKTLTSKVSVRDICRAIAKYAFVTSPYPILISAEIHCSVKQQDALVQIMIDAFGDSLVRAPVEGRPALPYLPSPDALKGKILVKASDVAKNLYVSTQFEALRSNPASSEPSEIEIETPSEDSEEEEESGAQKLEGEIKSEIKHGMKELKATWRHFRASSRSSNHGDAASKPKKIKMSMNFASLLVYTVGVKCHGFGAQPGYAPEHIFSLSENKINGFIKARDTMQGLVHHTKDHLVRIYPKGTRVNSSNYQPHRFWAAGAQLVAINWQTFDMGYMMTQAMFNQRNGRAGYVLKPEALRGNDELLSKHSKHVLEVTIISAHQLPRLKDKRGQEIVEKSIVDPLVEVSIYIPDWTHPPFNLKTGSTTSLTSESSTPPNDTESSTPRVVSQRTRTIRNNGFNPVWRETVKLPFDLVGGPEMADLVFVKFAVLEDYYDEDGAEPIAVYCAPLSCLEKGYRHLPLHDSQLSQYLFSTLFVQVQIHDEE